MVRDQDDVDNVGESRKRSKIVKATIKGKRPVVPAPQWVAALSARPGVYVPIAAVARLGALDAIVLSVVRLVDGRFAAVHALAKQLNIADRTFAAAIDRLIAQKLVKPTKASKGRELTEAGRKLFGHDDVVRSFRSPARQPVRCVRLPYSLLQVVPGQQGQAAAIILARLMYWFGHSRKVGGCRSQRRFPDDPPGVVWNKLEAKEIAAQTGLDCRAVDRAVDRLVAAGLIASVRGHVLRNVYARHLRPLEKAAELPPSDAAQEEETAGRDREEAATRELAAHLDASLPAILAHSALAGGSPDRPSVAGLSRMLGERIRWVSSPITPWLSSLVHDAPRVCNSVSSDRGAVMFHCLPRRSGVEPVNIVARRGRASAELIAAYRDTVIVVADGERRALLTSSRDWAATRSVELHETGPLPPPAAPSLRSCSADKQPRKDFRKGPRGASRFAGAQYAALVQLLRFGGMSPEGVADAVDFCRKHTNDEFAADQIDNEWWRDEQRWSLPVRLVPHDASRSSHPGLADVFGESHQLACLPPVVTLSEMECQRHDRPTIVYWRPGVPRWADERRARCPLFALREFDPVHDARPTFAFRIYLRIGSQRLVIEPFKETLRAFVPSDLYAHV